MYDRLINGVNCDIFNVIYLGCDFTCVCYFKLITYNKDIDTFDWEQNDVLWEFVGDEGYGPTIYDLEINTARDYFIASVTEDGKITYDVTLE